jgi:hypothetical protein
VGRAAVAASDRELVVALARTQNLTVEVAHVERTPGLELVVHLALGGDGALIEQTLRPLLLNEKIVIASPEQRTKEPA